MASRKISELTEEELLARRRRGARNQWACRISDGFEDHIERPWALSRHLDSILPECPFPDLVERARFALEAVKAATPEERKQLKERGFRVASPPKR